MMVRVLGTRGSKEQARGRRGKPDQGTMGKQGMKEQVLGRRGMKEQGTKGKREKVRGTTDTARRGKQLIACRTHSHFGTRLGIRCSMPVGLLWCRRSPHGCELHTHMKKTKHSTDLLLCQPQGS